MAKLEYMQSILHIIRGWLYPNYLEHGGKFIARVKTEKTLNVDQVCTEAVTRGGSDLNRSTMVDAVNTYFDEAFYQLADGFSVENDYFSIHPKIGGTFDNLDTKVDKEKNPIGFAFRRRQALRDVLAHTTVEIEGMADIGAYIAEALDVVSGVVDEQLTSGGVLTLLGNRIKIVGDDPSCGLYLINTADDSSIKVTTNLVDNQRNRISALIPALSAGTYRVRIITQYTLGTNFLKEPRQIDYEVDLVVS